MDVLFIIMFYCVYGQMSEIKNYYYYYYYYYYSALKGKGQKHQLVWTPEMTESYHSGINALANLLC